MIWLAVGVGGALGSMARHGVNHVFALTGRAAPLATAFVNLSGCLIIGILAGLIAHGRFQLSPSARAFVFTGILGGFTTFSTFGLDTFTLAASGQRWAAAWNTLGQVVLGLAAVAAGFQIGRQ